MIPVPYTVMNAYVTILTSREIPANHIEHYKKWLRCFYDFYSSYLDTEDIRGASTTVCGISILMQESLQSTARAKKTGQYRCPDRTCRN